MRSSAGWAPEEILLTSTAGFIPPELAELLRRRRRPAGSLKLNESKMVSALGIAGSQAAGLFAFLADGTMTKTLHAGKAAQNGILSAYLAKEGFTGPAYILEDKRGFYKAFADTFNPGGL